MVIYGMIGLIVLSVLCLALTFKYQKNKGQSALFRSERDTEKNTDGGGELKVPLTQ